MLSQFVFILSNGEYDLKIHSFPDIKVKHSIYNSSNKRLKGDKQEEMANHGFINGTLDGVNYSSPVPIIGLYIAAASALCLLLMLYDVIVAGFIARKWWLPCNRFTLNSVTLTLLTIAAKLPLDLTTPMPSPTDQLSKLSGTVIICISVGFLLPSLGVNSDSECFTNMAALTIFVVTVAVNIGLQLHTGVIVLFFVEHIIILCLMFVLLLMMWHASRHIKSHKRITGDQYRNLITRSTASMFDRLKVSYLYSYCSNPQYIISVQPVNTAVSIVCLISSIVLIQATFRSLIPKNLEFCQGTSDYGWSMPVIVISQILTVVVGILAVMFRWMALFGVMELESLSVSFQDNEVHWRNRILRKGWSALHRLQALVASFTLKIVLIAELLLVSPAGLVQYLLQLLRVYERQRLENFSDLNPGDIFSVTEYIARKSVNDILGLRKQLSKGESLKHLIKLVSDTPPYQLPECRTNMNLPSFSVEMLVKIAEASMPTELLESLLHAYREAYEIIHFIDKILELKPKIGRDDGLSYSKVVWRGGDFTSLLPNDIIRMKPGLDRASVAITTLREKLSSHEIRDHVILIADMIDPRRHASIEDLYKRFEQLFVSMLHVSFGQLPIAIFWSVTESPAEEFEERVRVAIKFILKVGSLDHVHWSCPSSCNIQSFVTNYEARGDRRRGFTGPLAGLENVLPISPDLDFKNWAPRGRHSLVINEDV